MTSEMKNQQAARFLHEAHRARQPYQPLPEEVSPKSIGEAYAMQDAFNELLIAEQGPVAGYKVALTTPVMQKMVGFDHPCAGAVLANRIHQSPANVKGENFGHLGAECEIAVLLKSDLPASGAPYDRASAAQAVGALMPSFELVDDRGADYSNLFFLGVVADLVWNAGVVLGPQITDWQGLELVAAKGTMTINGQPAGEGKGGDVLGHPLEALAWLANTLAEQGKTMAAGMIVMTGSIVSTKFLNPGDTAVVSIEGLGEATVTVG